jgi:hypothetical protein
VALSQCRPQQIGIHSGGPNGISRDPATIVSPPQNATAMSIFGVVPSGPGDVDGDGYADLVAVVNVDQISPLAGQAYLYRGGPSGISTASPIALPPPNGAFAGGARSVVSGVAGDVNGDGFFDILVGSLRSGSALLYRGAPGGVVPTPLEVAAGDGSSSGRSVARAAPSPRLR